MQVVGIVGPSNAHTASLADRLIDALSDRGRVAVVRREPSADGGSASPTLTHDTVAETHRLHDDGTWTGVRPDSDLDDVLCDLSPRVDYAVVCGFPGASIPTVPIGGIDHAGETLATPSDPDDADVDAIVASIDDAEPLETLESLVETVKRSSDQEFAGAIATFTGRVRTREEDADAPTEYLEFEKYEGVAEAHMDEIRVDLEAREGVYEVRLYHRTGVVEAGEDIVHVVVLAGHRAEAFAAVEDGIDRLKEEVPLFKKEVTVDGEFWAHER